jgi:hypothetical protein
LSQLKNDEKSLNKSMEIGFEAKKGEEKGQNVKNGVI